MKTNELMIGDWVQVPSELNRKKQIKSTFDLDSAVLYQPIPLIPEILEKNGFYYGYTSYEEDLASNTIATLSEDDKGWCWDEGAGAIKVIFPNEADGGLFSLDDQSFDRHFEMVFGGIIFLHELQHALRLCGIDKIIEL